MNIKVAAFTVSEKSINIMRNLPVKRLTALVDLVTMPFEKKTSQKETKTIL